jgi:hypothetical protein
MRYLDMNYPGGLLLQTASIATLTEPGINGVERSFYSAFASIITENIVELASIRILLNDNSVIFAINSVSVG